MTEPEEPAAGGAPEPGSDRTDAAGAGEEHAGEGHAGAGDAEQPQSGLRNPEAAVRGVGAGALVIEALVLLLAIVPLTKLDTRATGWAVASVLVLCVVCVALAGLMRYRWAWYAGIAVQVLICFCGFYHLMLLAMGIIFGGIWGYVLSVRRSVLGRI